MKETFVFKNKITEGTYFKGTSFDFKITQVKQKPYYRVSSYIYNTRDFQLGMDLILSVENSKIKNSNVYYTDSNGLFEMKRQKSDVFENDVYPVTSFIHIADEAQKIHLKVYSDRAEGGFSIFEGIASLYVQRSAKVDDHKGNPEVLEVTENVHTEHIVLNYVEGSGDFDEMNAEIINNFDIRY